MTALTALIGATMLSFGLQGTVMSIRINIIESIVLCIGSLLLIKPGLITDVIGLGTGSALIAFVYIRNKKRKETADAVDIV